MQQTSIYVLAATWAVSAAFVVLGQSSKPPGGHEKPRIVINTLLWRLALLTLTCCVVLAVAAIDNDTARTSAKCTSPDYKKAHSKKCANVVHGPTLTKNQRSQLNQFVAVLLVLFGYVAVRSAYRSLVDRGRDGPTSRTVDRTVFAGLALVFSCFGAVGASVLFAQWLTRDLGDAGTTLQALLVGGGALLLFLTLISAAAATYVDEESETLDYGSQRRLAQSMAPFGGRWVSLKIRPAKLGPADAVDPIELAAFRSGGNWYMRSRDANELVLYHWRAARAVSEPHPALVNNHLEAWLFWKYIELRVAPMEWTNRTQRAWAYLKLGHGRLRRRRRDKDDPVVNATHLVRVDRQILKAAGLEVLPQSNS